MPARVSRQRRNPAPPDRPPRSGSSRPRRARLCRCPVAVVGRRRLVARGLSRPVARWTRTARSGAASPTTSCWETREAHAGRPATLPSATIRRCDQDHRSGATEVMDDVVREYIDAIAPEHRPLFDRIHRLVLPRRRLHRPPPRAQDGQGNHPAAASGRRRHPRRRVPRPGTCRARRLIGGRDPPLTTAPQALGRP